MEAQSQTQSQLQFESTRALERTGSRREKVGQIMRARARAEARTRLRVVN